VSEPRVRPAEASAWDAAVSSVGGDHFRPDIEGLRAVAVLAVLAFHARIPLLQGGFIGVDVFFVISGYLITGLLVRELRSAGRIDLRRFYARRARRLLPAALVVIAVTLLASWFLLPTIDFPDVARDGAAAALYVSNYRFALVATDYFAAQSAPSPLLHYWSLGVEEQFYLFWPLLLLMVARVWSLRRLWAVALAVAVASFALSLWITGVDAPWAFYSLPTRAWQLALGALAALGVLAIPARWPSLVASAVSALGLALIVAGVLLIKPATPFPGVAALLPAAGAALVIVGGERHRGPVGRALATPVPRWFGRISYSLYLWHWPVIVIALTMGPELSLADRVLLLALTFVLSLFTYLALENPIRRNGWLMANAARALVPALLLTGTGVAAAYGNARLAVRDLDPQQRVIAASAAEPSTARARAGCVQDYETVTPAPCVFGDGRRVIALFGDSHADHWSTPLIEAGRKNGYRVVTWLKNSCRASRISVWSAELKRPYAECDRWREQAIGPHGEWRPALLPGFVLRADEVFAVLHRTEAR